MSGHFVIWNISENDIDEIFETFQIVESDGKKRWDGVAHLKGVLINPNGPNVESNKYQGWDEKNTEVFTKGVKWLGFPKTRDTVPPHNYIKVLVQDIKPDFFGDNQKVSDFDVSKPDDRLKLSKLLEETFLKKQSSEKFTWLDKLSIVPIEGQPLSTKAANMDFSNTKLAVEALNNVGEILDPKVLEATKHYQVKLAFFKQLAIGNAVSFEIYSIDKLKIANPNDRSKGIRRKHWSDASSEK